MHGRITKFSTQNGFGVIEADNGSRYRFAGSEILNLNGKLVGNTVDFVATDVDFVLSARRPKDIILMTGTPWSVFGHTHH